MWDAERRRHVIVLRNHVVQIVARRGIDWTWRVERVDAPPAGLVLRIITLRRIRRRRALEADLRYGLPLRRHSGVAFEPVFDSGVVFALIRMAPPFGSSMSNAPVLRTRSLSFR